MKLAYSFNRQLCRPACRLLYPFVMSKNQYRKLRRSFCLNEFSENCRFVKLKFCRPKPLLGLLSNWRATSGRDSRNRHVSSWVTYIMRLGVVRWSRGYQCLLLQLVLLSLRGFTCFSSAQRITEPLATVPSERTSLSSVMFCRQTRLIPEHFFQDFNA